MSIFASVSVVNISRSRSSSLSFPLKDSIYPFSQGLPGSINSALTPRSFNHLRNAFAKRSHQTDDQKFFIPYLLMIKNEKDLIKKSIRWQKVNNLDRPHQGLGNLTPYEKLKSLGCLAREEICLFPCLILDSACCFDSFKIKRKSVQVYLDHYPFCPHTQLFC